MELPYYIKEAVEKAGENAVESAFSAMPQAGRALLDCISPPEGLAAFLRQAPYGDIYLAGSASCIGPAGAEIDLIRIGGDCEAFRIYAILGGDDLAATPGFIRWYKTHNGMLASFRAGDAACFAQDMKEAREAAESASLPLDPLYDLYGARMPALITAAYEGKWDGAWRIPTGEIV